MIFQMPMKVFSDPKRPGTSDVLARELRHFRVFDEKVFLEELEGVVRETAERERADFDAFELVFEVLLAMPSIGVVARIPLEALRAEAAANYRDFLLFHHCLLVLVNDDDVR